MPFYDIIIVDDHPIVREGVKNVLSGMEGVRCSDCSRVEQLLNLLIHNNHFDLCILDLEFPEADILPSLNTIREISSHSRILIYSIHNEPWVLAKLRDFDIHGFISKASAIEDLLQTVRTIRAGGKWFSDSYMSALDGFSRSADIENDLLTDREKEVLYYLSKGFTTSEIADKLHISYLTAKKHRSNLAKKLDAHNAVDIVRKGQKYI